MIAKLCHWYDLAMTREFDRLRSPLLLVLRLFIGWQFFQSGWGKLHGINHVIALFTRLRIPAPTLNAYFGSTLQCVGGVLLLVGASSGVTAIPLTINMIVAYVTADREALVNMFKNPDGFTGATPFLFLLVSVIVLAFGPGVFSIDYLIGRMRGRRART